MAKSFVAGKEAEELKMLYAEYSAAAVHAGAVLGTHGMASTEFADADAKTTTIRRRINEILEN